MVWRCVWEVVVIQAMEKIVFLVVEEMLVWLVEELAGWIVAGSLRFLGQLWEDFSYTLPFTFIVKEGFL